MTQEITTLTFVLTVDEANQVIQGIQELPAKIANPLTRKLQEQAKEQMPAPAEPTE